MNRTKLVENAERLASTGRVAEAYELLDRAAHSGDALAAFTLAGWRITGQFIRRDLALARQLFGRAADLGLAEAQAPYIAMLANGAGGTQRRWAEALDGLRTLSRDEPMAARQAALLGQMDVRSDGEPQRIPASVVLNESPRITTFQSFLTRPECAYLIDRATPLLRNALVIDPTTGARIRDPIRTARSTGFPFVLEEPLVHAINRRIAAATGTTYEQGEPLQILSYEPGQEYKLHSDALANDPNQRTHTFLVYLNEGFDGGDTFFPDLGISFRGRSGDAIVFCNVDEDGRPDARARHAGRAVQSGRKMLLSKWIRQAPLDLSGPPGRPF